MSKLGANKIRLAQRRSRALELIEKQLVKGIKVQSKKNPDGDRPYTPKEIALLERDKANLILKIK